MCDADDGKLSCVRSYLYRLMRGSSHLYAYSAAVGALYSWRPIRDVRRILIYKLDHIGDVLIATPALRAIRRRFPEAEIKIVIGEWSQAVLAHNPNVDDVLVYNSTIFTRPPHVPHRLRDLKAQLGDWRPDLEIGLRDDWRTISHAIFSGVRHVERGRAHMMEWFRRKRTGLPHMHELDKLWVVLRPLGIHPEPVERLEYYVTDGERKKSAEFMRRTGISRPFAAVHVGTSVLLKEWPIDRFADAVWHIHQQYGMQIVLVGSPEERDRARQLAKVVADLDPVDISGQLDLRETAALIERSSLYLGSDGGLMHMASALGVPTLGLFGPGSYHIFHPVGRHSAAISHLYPCSPCEMTNCVRPHDTCMRAITVDEVIQETDLLMRRVQRRKGMELEPTPVVADMGRS